MPCKFETGGYVRVMLPRTRLLVGFLLILCVWTPLAMGSDDEKKLFDAAFRILAEYNEGDNRETLEKIREWVRQAADDVESRARIEERLLVFLGSKSTLAAKRFVCGQLGLIGTAASLPVLVPLALQSETSASALSALEVLPMPEVDAALRTVLPKSSGTVKIALIHSLGRRGDPESIPLLEKLASSKDTTTAEAAVQALGRMGGLPALGVLERLRPQAGARFKLVLADAAFACAERMLKEGRRTVALEVYRRWNSPTAPAGVRVGAMRGIVRSAELTEVRETLSGGLNSADEAVVAAAIRLLGGLGGAEPVRILVDRFPQLQPVGRSQVISVLADQRERGSLPLVLKAVEDRSREVRLAALEALVLIGDHTCVLPLAQAAATRSDPERSAARSSLARIPGSGVDAAVLAAVAVSDAPVKVELIRAIGERRPAGAAEALMQGVRHRDANVRRESLRALRDTAGPAQLKTLLSVLSGGADEAERAEIQAAFASTAKRHEKAVLPDLAAAYRQSEDPVVRSVLLQAFGTLGSPEVLPLLREALAETDPQVTRAAILGLTAWPTDEAAPELLQVASGHADPRHKILALRGYIEQVSRPSERRPKESVGLLAEALRVAGQADEKKRVLAVLPRFACPEALALAQSLVDDADTGAEARRTVEAITRALNRDYQVK